MTHMWNSTTGTIYLKSTDGVPVHNFKSFYPGFDMIGKHFKLRSSSNQNLNRHYTICNVMRPTYYHALVKSLRNGDDSDFGRHLLDSSDKPIQSFTIKNYNQILGLSKKFYDPSHSGRTFEVAGPFGKGLCPESEGIHLAFAAGTGALTFMDLVALIGINNLAKRGEIQDYRKSLINYSTRLPSIKEVTDEEKVVIGHSFKFVFYVSFPHRGDSLGLELCEALT